MRKLANIIIRLLGGTPPNPPTLAELRAEVAAIASGETQQDLVKISAMLYKLANPYVLTQKLKKAGYKDIGNQHLPLVATLASCAHVADVKDIKRTAAYKAFKDTLLSLTPPGVKLIDTVESEMAGHEGDLPLTEITLQIKHA